MHNKLVNELAICGLNTVKAAAQYNPQKINRLFLREERLPLFKELCGQLARRKRPYKICDDEELLRICKDQHHQGIVAMIEDAVIEPLTREDLDLWVNEAKTGVVLHSIGNDFNLGAIARAAAFFDAYFIVISEFEAKTMAADTRPTEKLPPEKLPPEKLLTEKLPPERLLPPRLSTAAFRAAEGGMEHVVVRSVRKTASFLRDASKKLFTIGTGPRARLRIGDLPAIMKERKSGVALVLGNEEAGLPEEVKLNCSSLLRIPGTGSMESLNVAQSAALFLHAIYEAQ
ncbi:MAG: RNA methyltransferase [Spirochaetaceae bacterium]|jgi:TrmH RNA methyltransferase|nr:RNA methyltransferase [Spirochaetaceae bacterium]